MRFSCFTAVLASILSTLLSCANRHGRLCDHIQLHEGELPLSKNERVLVCGTGHKGDVEGWHAVPLPQAEYQLKVLLQNEGYLRPRFERHEEELDVWSGPRERIEALHVENAAGLLQPGKKRQVIGAPLTPAKLDEIKQWAELRLREKGYACSDVNIRAEAWNHTVTATVTPGRLREIGGVDYSGLGGLDTQSLARHQAMQPGDVYDVRETQLTAQRMLNDALFDTAYFKTTCHPDDDKVDLHLVTSVGRPRIFRFGLGASTEEFPFTQIWFKNARLDDRASSFTATLYASPKLQSLKVGSEFYRVPYSKRSYFGPRLLAEHDKENAFEATRAQVGVDLGRLWDMWKLRWRARVGPTLNHVNTISGIGPRNAAYVSWEGALSTLSRDLELFPQDQFSGWQADFSYRGQRRGLGSPINVDRFELGLKKMWNIGHYDPPLFVLGTRARIVAVNSTETDIAMSPQLLPSEYREFMGGDANLRGFGRTTLDNGDFGYLTTAYFGTELRLVRQLPYKLEPFLLFDLAQFGTRRLTLDRPLYLSDGVGLRWPSPFGTFRGSAARGRIWNGSESTHEYRQNWVYFLSFGQEF